MDIVYGDCLVLGGFRHALLLVDVTTRYCWLYGMPTLTSSHIVAPLKEFEVDTNSIPLKFHTGFNEKLISGKALHWILKNKRNIYKALPGNQSFENEGLAVKFGGG